MSTTTTYYHKGTPGEQGSVIDEQTGRTVAVVYDAKDAPLLAAAPTLRDALQRLADVAYAANRDQHAGIGASPEQWSEMYQATNAAYAALADAPYTE